MGSGEPLLGAVRRVVRASPLLRWESVMEVRRVAAAESLDTKNSVLATSRNVLLRNYRRWEWTKDLDEQQVEKLAVIVGNVLWREYEKQKRRNKRYRLDSPKPMTAEEVEWFMPAQSRNYVALVLPVE